MAKSIDREAHLDEILAGFLVAEEEGQAPDRRDFLKGHPQYAVELKAFFAVCGQLEQMAQPLKAVARAARFEGASETPSDQWATTPPANRPDEKDAAAGGKEQDPKKETARPEPQNDPSTCDHISNRGNADSQATQPPRKPPDFNKATGGPKTQKSQASSPVVPGYEILGVLGKGGMGVVYKARHLELKRIIALKMIKSGAHADAEDHRRFRAEAEAVARLHHPNIVQIFEIGEHNGQPYFALEFCAGGSLAAKLKPKGATEAKLLAPREAALALETLAVAMEHAHGLQVLHRDLKPANVLVGADGTLKVTDFGLAKQLDAEAVGQSTAVVGTPPYMAPEQAEGKSRELGPAVDVYALGAVLYEMLTGRPPFQGNTTMDVLLQVIKDPPLPPSRLQPKIPRDLENICLKCLEKDRRRRYASAGALAADLGRFLAGEPVEARATHWLERGVMWARRYPARATVMAMTVLVALLVTVGSVIAGLWFEAEDARAKTEIALDGETIAKTVALDAKDKEADANKKLAVTNNTLDATNKKLKVTNMELDTEKEKVSHFLYCDHILLGWKYLQDGNTLLARASHDECAEKYRKLEWYQLKYRLEPEILSLEGHKFAVDFITFSQDNLKLASRGGDQSAILWNLSTGRKIAAENGFRSVAYSPDSRWLAGASGDSVKLLDANTGQTVAILLGHKGAVNNIAFAPDGKLLASAGQDRTVRLWDVPTHKEVAAFLGHKDVVIHVAFSPDGKWLASAGDDKAVIVWDVAKLAKVRELESHKTPVAHIAWSPDSQRLACAAKDDLGSTNKSVFGDKLWDVGKGKVIAELARHTQPVTHLAFSPDGKHMATASGDHTIQLWDAKTGRASFSLVGHTGVVQHCCFSPDSASLASASADKTVRIWDPRTGKQTGIPFEHKGGAMCVAYSPNGRWLASAGVDGAVKLADVKCVKEVAALPGHKGEIRQVAYSSDGKWLASAGADSKVILRDAVTGQELHKLVGHTSAVTHVEFSRDDRRVASASGDGTIKLWNALTGAIIRTMPDDKKPKGAVMHLAFSPDGQLLASASSNKMVELWNARTGDFIATLKGHQRKVGFVAFSPDGKTLVSASEDKSIGVWDVHSRRLIKMMEGHNGKVTQVAFSQDGQMLASVSDDPIDDHNVRLWDMRSHREIAKLVGHTGAVTSVAFNPKVNSQLASGGRDSHVKLWDTARPGKATATLVGHSDYIRHVGFSPDGERLATAGNDGNVFLWDALTGKEVADLAALLSKGVRHVAFRPDGQQLASAGGDGAVRLWYGKMELGQWEKRKQLVVK